MFLIRLNTSVQALNENTCLKGNFLSLFRDFLSLPVASLRQKVSGNIHNGTQKAKTNWVLTLLYLKLRKENDYTYALRLLSSLFVICKYKTYWRTRELRAYWYMNHLQNICCLLPSKTWWKICHNYEKLSLIAIHPMGNPGVSNTDYIRQCCIQQLGYFLNWTLSRYTKKV